MQLSKIKIADQHLLVEIIAELIRLHETKLLMQLARYTRQFIIIIIVIIIIITVRGMLHWSHLATIR